MKTTERKEWREVFQYTFESEKRAAFDVLYLAKLNEDFKKDNVAPESYEYRDKTGDEFVSSDLFEVLEKAVACAYLNPTVRFLFPKRC